MSARIDHVLEQAVTAGRVPGLVAMAQKGGGPLYEKAAGLRALGEDDPMTMDTVFRIASMTKAVTSTAAMQLVERGAFSLDTPVAEIVPEWSGMRVIEGWDGDVPRLREPRTVATIRHLASHTAGLTYEFLSEDHLRLVGQGHPAILSGERKVLDAPLAFDPGTGWMYGQNIDWLGLCVEAASGQTLDKYFAEHILGPAGMTDTGFSASAEQRARMAKVHMPDGQGGLVATPMDWAESPEYLPGGHGLYSTAADYMRFLDVFRRGGKGPDGTSILQPETIAVMTSDQSGGNPMVPLVSVSPVLCLDAEFFPGSPKVHSTAFQINLEDQPGMRAGGSLAWAGIFNSFYWWDPRNDTTGVLLMQLLPFADPGAVETFTEFEQAVYASL
jgi:CubicO group peptidase (beta-lactamase class C family)